MSCHDIGRGLNSVVRTTIGLKDEGEISAFAAKTIIKSCARGVNWCDGNDYEAVDYIHGCVCGSCLRKIPAFGKLYSLYDVSDSVPGKYRLMKEFATDRLCETFFDAVVGDACGDENAAPRERAYIEEHCTAAEYESTGEYKNSNNGCAWD